MSAAQRRLAGLCLALSGFGDADMMNYFTEDGQRITPYGVARTPIGPRVARMCESFGARYFVPFSSLHKYQRADLRLGGIRYIYTWRLWDLNGNRELKRLTNDGEPFQKYAPMDDES